jgi:hypothetical protein
MQDFFTWIRGEPTRLQRPWVILGKGPTFKARSRYDLQQFNTLGLNHVCREQPVTVAHIIDLDVVDGCGEALANAAYVVMPWRPHVRVAGSLSSALTPSIKPGPETLAELTHRHPVLRRLDTEGRLLYYNLSTASDCFGDSPVVNVRYFSAEAALNLLAAGGAGTVRSLGVDGGNEYSADFEDLRDQTLLANGRTSFNRQFEEFAKTIMTSGVDYAPLDIDSPVRVYVATTDAQMLSVKVLEYSIRKHASMSVQVFPIHEAGREVPLPRDARNQPRTPFSFQRFLIPSLAGYRGRAIYLDSDMQVFRDIRPMWTRDFRGSDLLTVREPEETGRKPQFSVMLLNCDTLRWNISDMVARLDSGGLTYEQLMVDMAVADHIRADIGPEWNSLERFEEGKTALVHYTDMNTQPWVSTTNPLGYLWMRDLFEAIDCGFLSREFVADHVARGYVRPSLLDQIDRRVEDPVLLPGAIKAKDRSFQAPFTTIHRHGGSPWRSPLQFGRAAVRQLYQRSPLYRLQRRVRNRMSM